MQDLIKAYIKIMGYEKDLNKRLEIADRAERTINSLWRQKHIAISMDHNAIKTNNLITKLRKEV